MCYSIFNVIHSLMLAKRLFFASKLMILTNTMIRNLEADGSILSNWFSSNLMTLNDDKCHLMIFGNTKNDND